MPATILTACTAPFNPTPLPDNAPTLRIPQIWAGMLYKCRNPHKGFVAVMTDCEVLSETDTEIERLVTFKSGGSKPGGKAKEKVVLKKPMKADFYQDNGSVISNIVSVGAAPEELYLTFTFEVIFPDLEEGSQEEEEKRKVQEKMGMQAVEHTIQTIRAMVKDGRIKE